jgi:hypothetical protein
MVIAAKITGVLALAFVVSGAELASAQSPWGESRAQRSRFFNPFGASQRFSAQGGFSSLRSANPFYDLAPVTVPTEGSTTVATSTDAATSAVVSEVPAEALGSLSSGSEALVAPAMSLRPPFQPPVRSPFRPRPRPALIP